MLKELLMVFFHSIIMDSLSICVGSNVDQIHAFPGNTNWFRYTAWNTLFDFRWSSCQILCNQKTESFSSFLTLGGVLSQQKTGCVPIHLLVPYALKVWWGKSRHLSVLITDILWWQQTIKRKKSNPEWILRDPQKWSSIIYTAFGLFNLCLML